MKVRRLRMFAGPNGSGKTTLQRKIAGPFGADFLGVVINPDDLEASINRDGFLDLKQFNVIAGDAEARNFFARSAFLQSKNLATAAERLRCEHGVIDFSAVTFNSYHASVLADFLRQKLVAHRLSFSFETVMSDPGKVEFLRQARNDGYRTYLYFVATEAPEINAFRVQLRVKQGGHTVPEDKVIARYYRSLELVREAICHTDRAFFFDTSSDVATLVAESASGELPKVALEQMPSWFKRFVWDRY